MIPAGIAAELAERLDTLDDYAAGILEATGNDQAAVIAGELLAEINRIRSIVMAGARSPCQIITFPGSKAQVKQQPKAARLGAVLHDIADELHELSGARSIVPGSVRALALRLEDAADRALQEVAG